MKSKKLVRKGSNGSTTQTGKRVSEKRGATIVKKNRGQNIPKAMLKKIKID